MKKLASLQSAHFRVMRMPPILPRVSSSCDGVARNVQQLYGPSLGLLRPPIVSCGRDGIPGGARRLGGQLTTAELVENPGRVPGDGTASPVGFRSPGYRKPPKGW
jgi:hypothetical protein